MNSYGSGGGIRLIAGQLLGSGAISAIGQSTGINDGRIRLEATNTTGLNLNLNPPTIVFSPFPFTIWPATNAPTVQVISVAAQSAPADPKAAMSASGADLAIANLNPITILLQTSNFPTNGTVNVYIKPLISPQQVLTASFVSGNSNAATWQVTTTLGLNHTVIQARAVVP